MKNKIKFKKGYKYVLEGEHTFYLPDIGTILNKHVHVGKMISLTPSGVLKLADRYAWDGATLAPDLPCFYTASLIHDALYQVLRNIKGATKAERKSLRKLADMTMLRHALDRNFWLAYPYYWAVRLFGPRDGGKIKETLTRY